VGTRDVIGNIAPPRPVRRSTQPLKNRAPFTLSGRGELLHPVGDSLGAGLTGDSSGQRSFRVAQRSAYKHCDPLIAGQYIAVLVQPNPGHPRKRIGTEGHFRRAAQMPRQPTLGMLRQMPEPECSHGDLLMIEQGALAAVQPADRRQLWRRQIELPTQMLQYGRWQDLRRIQGPAGHPQESDLQADTQPVEGATPGLNSGQFLPIQREKLIDLGDRHRR
jgi:hypothetical protein